VCAPCSPVRKREREREREKEGEGERVALGSAIASRKCSMRSSFGQSVSMREYREY